MPVSVTFEGMYLLLYNLFLRLYVGVAKLMAFRNAKAAAWVAGRKHTVSDLQHWKKSNSKPVIWIHAASLGEFEQGKPIIESIRQQYPNYAILISFFSPSGLEPSKHYPHADNICFLPMDGKKTASTFIDIVEPSLAIFIKYEFWYYYLTALHSRKIPTLLIAAIFRKDQPFFKWYGQLHRKMLQTYSAIFVQNENSLTLLHEAGYTGEAMISGDSRFDRVAAIATQFSPLSIIENFIQDRTTIVAGSTWPKDHTILQELIQAFPNICFIVAPHHVDASSMQAACKQIPEAVLYADAEKGKTGRVLLIDRIGLLTKLYHYADITWIGGGFDKDGVHNVLEAAVYHKPVLFGPVYHKYAEAIELIEAGGAIVMHDGATSKERLKALLSDVSVRKMIGEKAGNYVASKKGATERIIHWIQLNRLLTN